MKNIHFNRIEDKDLVIDLETEWRNNLTFPNDDYWEAVLDSSQYWLLNQEEKIIGYACLSDRNTLLQFFVSAKWLEQGRVILEYFIKEQKIKKARISTNNPIFLSLSMHFQKSVVVDGYLFKDMTDVSLKENTGDFKTAKPEDLERLVDFSHRVLDAPKDWLNGYISNWISREEFFLFERDGKIVGTCESRTTPQNSTIASLGIVVCPEHRSQGIGSYLLGKAKTIAKSRNQQAICGCEKDNISSLKAIEKNGFRIIHLSLILHFEDSIGA